MVWKTQKMVGKGKKTFLANISIFGLTSVLLISWLFASIARSPIGRADWNYYSEYCGNLHTVITKLNGVITDVSVVITTTCSL